MSHFPSSVQFATTPARDGGIEIALFAPTIGEFVRDGRSVELTA